MMLKIDYLKAKWQDLKARIAPAVFPFAGHIFLGIVLIALSCVIIGWYGLSNETLNHNTATATPTATMLATPDYYESLQPMPMQTLASDQLFVRAHEDTTTAASLDDTAEVTVVRTVVLTVTSIITDEELETVTTAASASTRTTRAATTSPATDTGDGSTAMMMTTGSKTMTTMTTTEDGGGAMTGIMYCSFTGHRNVYTLCPLVHTDSPGMLTGAPANVSAAAPRSKNPLAIIRLAIASVWDSLSGLGGAAPQQQQQKKKTRDCDCDCIKAREKLDWALGLVRMQQRVIDGQRDAIAEHGQRLSLVLEMLANVTTARAVVKMPRTRFIELQI